MAAPDTDVAGLSIRELLAACEQLAASEHAQWHHLAQIVPQLEQLVTLIREGVEGAGERGGSRPRGKDAMCSRCVKIMQREKLRAYEQSNEHFAMRYLACILSRTMSSSHVLWK